MDEPVQLECAWCRVVLAVGAPPASHGICDRCYGVAVSTLEEALLAAERGTTLPSRHGAAWTRHRGGSIREVVSDLCRGWTHHPSGRRDFGRARRP